LPNLHCLEHTVGCKQRKPFIIPVGQKANVVSARA
jgi:hypothetical protein